MYLDKYDFFFYSTVIRYLDWIPRKNGKTGLTSSLRRCDASRRHASRSVHPSVRPVPSLPPFHPVRPWSEAYEEAWNGRARACTLRASWLSFANFGHVLLLRFASTDPIGANRVVIIGNALSTFVGERLWSYSIRDRFFFSNKDASLINVSLLLFGAARLLTMEKAETRLKVFVIIDMYRAVFYLDKPMLLFCRDYNLLTCWRN